MDDRKRRCSYCGAMHLCRKPTRRRPTDSEAVGRESDHHAADRGKRARTFSEIRDHINSDHPCCIPIGDACVLLAHADALAEASRGFLVSAFRFYSASPTPSYDERFEGALGALREVLAAHDKRRGK